MNVGFFRIYAFVVDVAAATVSACFNETLHL